MRELFFFASVASIALTVFIVSLVELFFVRHRRKVREDLENKLKDIKSTYTEQINKVVLEDTTKMEEAEKKMADLVSKEKKEKKDMEESFEKKLEDLTAHSEKAIEDAKKKAKVLQQEAKMQADEYMKNRQKEVEKDLMNLVLKVTKQVLPEGITYQAQKDLVLKALQDVKKEESPS